jgi:hypothetical protein
MLIAFSLLLLLPFASQSCFQFAHAETATADGWITVYPTTEDSPRYTSVGQNWTLSFQALWSHGDNAGQAVENATVTIQITSTTKDKAVGMLEENTTSAGILSFNYSSLNADVLAFNATKLVTQDGTEYDASLDTETGLYGVQSKPVTVWYDTFHVALLEYSTDSLGTTRVSVNVTYQLLPEEGLSLPAWATYSNQTFLPKSVHGAQVTINSVKAQESAAEGIYSANVSTHFSTAYIHVGVSQQNWVTTNTGFSFAHSANTPLWLAGVAIGAAFVVGILILKAVMARKAKDNIGSWKRSVFPFFGGVLLAVASVASLYWGLVGVEGFLHGFDWVLLAILGVFSFVFGLAGA